MNIKKITMILMILALTFALISCGGSTDGFTKNDLDFEYSGQTFSLDGDVAPLILALGDGYEFEEAVSCAFSGMDKIYSYPGIDIYTYPLDGKDNIDEIYISSSDYSTKKGITVGSSLDDINEAYGENYNFSDGYMLVIAPEGNADDTSDPCLYFIIENDKVIEFSFYSASNRQ